jgi:hypothetical protein
MHLGCCAGALSQKKSKNELEEEEEEEEATAAAAECFQLLLSFQMCGDADREMANRRVMIGGH